MDVLKGTIQGILELLFSIKHETYPPWSLIPTLKYFHKWPANSSIHWRSKSPNRALSQDSVNEFHLCLTYSTVTVSVKLPIVQTVQYNWHSLVKTQRCRWYHWVDSLTWLEYLWICGDPFPPALCHLPPRLFFFTRGRPPLKGLSGEN